MSQRTDRQYVICINNAGYAVSLLLGKTYRRLPDPAAEAHGFVRVIDESGEDYLYDAVMFEPAP